jgi:uncharacterized membrane protein YkoI
MTRPLSVLLAAALFFAPLTPRLVWAQQPATPAAPAVKKELTRDEAVQIALKKVPGTESGVPYTTAPQPYRIFVHSKGDKDCEVVVDRMTGAVKKVITPRLTRKQAVKIARKKAPGRVMEGACSYHEDEGAHTIMIEQSGGIIARILVSDRTGKVIKVEKGKDAPG